MLGLVTVLATSAAQPYPPAATPVTMSVAELQAATVRPPTGGGSVWVLGTGLATIQGGTSCVEARMVDGAGLPIAGYDAPLALDQAVNDSLLLVNLGRTLPPQPVGLRLTRLDGQGAPLTALTPLVNTAEPHWVKPFARPGDSAFLVGRRFWSATGFATS